MAKKIRRKNTRKNIIVNATNFDGEKLSESTSKICCGLPIKDNPRCKKCIDLKNDLALICHIKAGFNEPVKIKTLKTIGKTGKTGRTKNNDMIEVAVFITKNPTINRKALIQLLLDDSEKILSHKSDRSAGGWKTLVGAIFLSLKHLQTPGKGAFGVAATGIIDGITDFKKLVQFVADNEGKTPQTVTRSVQFVYKTNLGLQSLKNL